MLMLRGQGGQVELCPKATDYLYIYTYVGNPRESLKLLELGPLKVA